ncbi:hypothetical protein D3C71_1200340 [compost metagenome]
MLVHVVGQNPDLRVLAQHQGQGFQLGAGIGGAGRVRRRVEDQPLGAWRDGGVQDLGAQLEAVGFLADHGDGLAAGQQHHVRVGHPVGGGDDDLVAGVQRSHEGVEDHRLAARGDVNLVGFVGQAVLARELGDDGGLQLGHAVGVGVFRLAALDGLDGRRLDVVGRVEVRFAGAQTDDVAAFAFQFPGPGGHGQGGRRLDAGEGGGLKAGHDYPVWWMW